MYIFANYSKCSQIKSSTLKTMKRVNLFLLIIMSAVIFISCTSNKKPTSKESEQAALLVDDILAAAEQEVDKTVVVEGICTHVCSHGAKKLFLMGDDDSKTIRVESSDALGSFKAECINNLVRVKGKLKEERIDEAYLVKWENELAEGTAEEHGEDGEGCETDQKAQGQKNLSSDTARINDFRAKIAERNKAEDKNFLSFYYIEAEDYSIL